MTYCLSNHTILGDGQDAGDDVTVLELLVVALDNLSDRECTHGLVEVITWDVVLEIRTLHAVTHVRVKTGHEQLDDHALGRRRREVDGPNLEGHVHVVADHALGDSLVDEGFVVDGSHDLCWYTELVGSIGIVYSEGWMKCSGSKEISLSTV